MLNRLLLTPAFVVCALIAAAALGWSLASESPAPSPSPVLAASYTGVPMPVCGAGKRVTCVVDGDTVWLDGERIRLADIDAPETDATCADARERAARATRRLAELLGRGPIDIARGDPADGRLQDRYGRTLAVIKVGGRSVGSVLVEEGLARPWAGRRTRWC